jgi:acyl carrier protein
VNPHVTLMPMTRRSAHDVKTLLLSCLERSMFPAGLAPDDVPDDFDMRAEGVVDSLGFVQLITELEQRLGFDIDLADLDPEQLTTVGPLARHIAAQDAMVRRTARG